MKLVVILKPFQSDGKKRIPGEIMDASNWNSAEKLKEQRRIKEFTGNKSNLKACEKCQRTFIDDKTLSEHVC